MSDSVNIEPEAEPDRPGAGCDPLLEALVYVARSHGRQVSRDGLTAGLPLEHQRLTPSLIPRAAERAGLQVMVTDCTPDRLQPSQLPAIALLKNDKAVVVVQYEGEVAVVCENGESVAVPIPISDLVEQSIGSCVLLRPQFEFDDRAPRVLEDDRQGWFWSAMKENLPIYRDVLIAATLINLFAIALPLFTMNVYDRVVPNHATETLWMLAAGIIFVIIMDFSLRNMRAYFLDLAGKRIDLKLSSFIMERVLGLQMEHRPISAGSFAANLRSYESVRDFITSATLTAIVDLPFALLFIMVIAWIAPPMLIPIIVAVLFVLGYTLSASRRMHELSEQTYRTGATRNAVLIESLVGLESVKTLGAEGEMQQRWESSAAYLADKGAQLRILSNSVTSMTASMSQLLTVVVIITGVYLITHGELSMGALIACTMLSGRTMGPFATVAGLMMRYNDTRTALEALNQIVEKPVERPYGAHFISRQSFNGDIEFRDVEFAYPNTEMNSLRGVSFKIKPGEKVAILGRTGSGKSTILRMILGLYRPVEGSVLIDGIDLRQLDPGELRRNVGYVPQDISLFFGNLRDNLTMGSPHVEDEDIIEAARIAHLTDYVNRHPRGFELQVGERGETLSGGQRESVALARAVLNKPPMLLLDEPTSSMDASTEDAVKKNLKEILADRTMVVVTHRTSLLELVDRIIVMDNGRVVADGPKASVVDALRQGRVGKAS